MRKVKGFAPRRIVLLLGGSVFVAALGLVALASTRGGSALGVGTTLSLSGVPASVAAGGPAFDVEISVAGVTNLGAYEWQLQFDPAVVQFVGATNGPFLGSTGRTAWCVPPIHVPSQGKLRFGCGTFGSVPPGPDGGGLLSTVTFEPVADGAPNIQFVCAILANPLGEDIPISNVPPCVAPVTPTPYVTPTGTPVPPANTIPAGVSSVTVLDGTVSSTSHITVTLTSDPRRSTCRLGRCHTFGTLPAVSWIEPMVGEGFIVHLTAPVGRDTSFTYWIQDVP